MTRAQRFATGVAPGIYRHYKGNLYEVLGTVRHSETLEELVLYKALYRNRMSALWVRPAAMFSETVRTGAGETPRFERVKKPAKRRA